MQRSAPCQLFFGQRGWEIHGAQPKVTAASMARTRGMPAPSPEQPCACESCNRPSSVVVVGVTVTWDSSGSEIAVTTTTKEPKPLSLRAALIKVVRASFVMLVITPLIVETAGVESEASGGMVIAYSMVTAPSRRRPSESLRVASSATTQSMLNQLTGSLINV